VDAPPTETTDEQLDACVIGGGPAGLAAAREIARAVPGARVTVYDEQAAPGGSLHAEPAGAETARALAAEAHAAPTLHNGCAARSRAISEPGSEVGTHS